MPLRDGVREPLLPEAGRFPSYAGEQNNDDDDDDDDGDTSLAGRLVSPLSSRPLRASSSAAALGRSPVPRTAPPPLTPAMPAMPTITAITAMTAEERHAEVLLAMGGLQACLVHPSYVTCMECSCMRCCFG